MLKVLNRAQATGLTYAAAQLMNDRDVFRRLYRQSDENAEMFAQPDHECVHAELARKGVTIQLLWQEYADKCQQNGELPYQKTQFRQHYLEWLTATGATMHIARKPGEQMEVDWAGATAKIADNITGAGIPAYLFVAVLPYSSYAYVEAFLDMRESACTARRTSTPTSFSAAAT